MADAKRTDGEESSYREMAAEIESILGEIEGDREPDIDVLAHKVERASSLIQNCFDRLQRAEVRVKAATEDLRKRTSEITDVEE